MPEKNGFKQAFLLLVLLLVAFTAFGGGTNPPQIAAISFPATLPPRGDGRGVVQFQDPDGDVTTVRLAVVDGRYFSRTLTLDLHGAQEGSFTFSLACTPFPQEITLETTLYDRMGNKSGSRLFSFTCGNPPRYDYDREQATVRPVDTRVPLNFFIIKDGTTTLAEGASLGEGSPLGDPDPLIEQAIAAALLPGLEGIWDQCGLGFELGTVKVVDPERLLLGGRPLARHLFVLREGERVILADARTNNILGQALQAIDSLLRRSGSSILGKLNIFIVGKRILGEWQGEWRDVEGFSGTNPRYALVRWGAVAFDETTQGFHRPKQVTATLAHEIGHNLGLEHPNQDGIPGTERDPLNLMKGSGVTPSPRAHLLPMQCRVVLANLEETMLAGSRPPAGGSPERGNAGPRVAFEGLTEGATVSGEVELSVRGEGFSDLSRTGLAQFEFSQDGSFFEPIGTDRDGADGFSTLWNTRPLPNGEYLLRATIVDGRGQSATAELQVVVAN